MTCAAPARLPILPRSPSRQDAAALLREAERRRAQESFIEEVCFDKQITFIRDPAKRKWVFTARRSGKSTAMAMMLLQDGFRYPHRKQLYIGLSADSAENAIWGILEKELDQRKIRHSYNHTTHLLRLRNAAEIKLAGMDAGPREMNKLLGGKYHRVAVDECQSYYQDIEKMVEVKLSMAVTDYAMRGGGSIVLGGTPGDHMGEHYWFRLTRPPSSGPRLPGWSGHTWTVPDNPHMIDEVTAEWARLASINPEHYQDDPSFRSQWLGEWVIDRGTRVYKFEATRNELDASRDAAAIRSILARTDGWRFVIGVDFGWEDATAIVVAAYSLTDRRLYFVESEKHAHATFDQVGARLVALNAKWRPQSMTADMVGGGKQLSESLREKFRLPLEMADKAEKQHHVARMNSDFLSSAIQIFPGANAELAREWNELELDQRAISHGEWKEAARFANHLTDAALYAWRYSVPFRPKVAPPPTAPKPDIPALILEQRARVVRPPSRDMFDRLDERREAQAIVERFRGRSRRV